MKQKFLEALKLKFEGVSDNTLSRIAEKLARTVTGEEGVQPAVDGVTFQQVIDGEADRRATEAAQTAVANYEKKHSLKEGKPVGGGGQGAKTNEPKEEEGNETPAWAKALIESNRTLGEKLADMEGEKVTASRKRKLDAAIGKLPDSLKKPYSRISLKDMSEDEFNTFITETEDEAKGLVSELLTEGAVIKAPMRGGVTKKEPSKEEAANIVGNLI